jgi:hypothetical protein
MLGGAQLGAHHHSIPSPPPPQFSPSTAVLPPSKHPNFLIDAMLLESNSTQRKRTSSIFLIALRSPFCISHFPANAAKNGLSILSIQRRKHTRSFPKPNKLRSLQESTAPLSACAHRHEHLALSTLRAIGILPARISNRYAPRLETPSNPMKTNNGHAF